MEFRSEVVEKDGVVAEIATVTFNGKDSTVLGSLYDPASGLLCGYPHKLDDGSYELRTWDGKTLCALRCTGHWKRRVLGSPFKTEFFSFSGEHDGKRFSGRNGGDGMLLRMRTRRVET